MGTPQWHEGADRDMYLQYTSEQQALQRELRSYFGELMTDEVKEGLKGHGDDARRIQKQVVRQLGADGWLGVGWPEEYGGQGRTALEQFIFYDEAQRAGVPIPMIALNTVGPTIMRFGTEEQKDHFLPGILRGEIDFAIGYTEPGAGTDMFALETRAVREGDHYIVNGTKVFTSGGDTADYVWLAARTDPDAEKRHRGISLLLVDTTLPGFRTTPIVTIAGGQTTASYYEDVAVPVSMRVGEENQGVKLITTQLNHERIALAAGRGSGSLVESVRDWATEARTVSGARVIDIPWVQHTLARVYARLEASKLMNWRVAWAVENDTLERADASSVKVYGTEVMVEACRLMLEIMGQAGTLKDGSPGAVLQGRLEQAYRNAIIGTFGGGGNEIQREMIAYNGLGTPRVPR